MPLPATISKAIVATQVGMLMALAYESAPGEYHTWVASGVGSSQEGEAMSLKLLFCVRGLVSHEGVYYVVPDFESTEGALRTYQEATTVGMAYTTSMHTPWRPNASPPRLRSTSWSPPHTGSPPSLCMDAPSRQELETDLTWMLQRPYLFLPVAKFRDHC